MLKYIGVFQNTYVITMNCKPKNSKMLALIQKYLNANSSEMEETELLNWVEKDESNKKIFIEQVKLWNYTYKDTNQFNTNKAFEILKRKINKLPERKQNPFQLNKYFKYAAVFVIGLLSFLWFSNSGQISETKGEGIVENKSKSEFNDKIILIKEDGSENIVPDKEEELSYVKENKPGEKLVYNSLIVPRGKIFKVILSDGTKVWLNADTKISFPQKFLATEDTRTVVLDGEAFFEVAHNKDKPFIVKSNNLEIEVLGTRFNVSSYTSSDQISTTLVEGSVKIKNSKDSIAELILKPSYQAAFNKNTEKLEVFKVNTTDFTAWMDNKVLFRNEAFKDLILKIERTYNVSIINQIPELEDERFTGEFDKESIEDIIKTFSSRLDFTYKIENKTITIY